MNETFIPLSPFCEHLRTKRYYFNERPARVEEDLLDGSARCWCALTMQAVGRDGDLVDPKICQAGRPCYLPFGLPTRQDR